MKLTFAPEDRTQAAVAAQQIELRRARPKRYPIGRWLVGALALAAVVVAIWWWLTATRIYSYGVVETGFEVFHAPVRSRVSSVLVGPGDRVKADQVLYVLASEDGQAQLTVTEEELSQQRRILEGALAEREVLFDDPAQELRDLGEARTRLAGLEREVAGLTLASAITTQDLQREVEGAARRAAFLAEGSATAAAAHERMQALRDLDAATGAEVRAAEEAARQAAHAASDAQADAGRLGERALAATKATEQELAARTASVADAGRDVAALEQAYVVARGLRNHEKERGIANSRSRVAALEARTAHLRTLAGPTEVRALADGVVTEVVVTEGSKVPADGMIMSMAGTGKAWVTAFVPPNRAKDVAIGGEVTIYPTTDDKPIIGKVTAGGGIQHKVPPALRDRVSDASAVYVRLDLDPNAVGLIPGNVVRVVIR